MAKRLDPVRLDRASALAVLLGEELRPPFRARAALRFVERFCAEAKPKLEAISRFCDPLPTIRRAGNLPAMSEGAFRALEDLARQLGRRST